MPTSTSLLPATHLLVEEPGTAAIAAHVARTGHGGWWTDDPAAPRTVLVHCGPERLLRGDPGRLDPAFLGRFGRGQFTAPDHFLPLLGRIFTTVTPWVRTVYVHTRPPRPVPPHVADWVRPLEPGDSAFLDRFAVRCSSPGRHPATPHWAAQTWGGHGALAAGGFAWGAFVGPFPAALACGYLVGRDHVDIAVATDPAFRRLGLGLACVNAATAAARRQGLTPTWAASQVNLAGRAVAVTAGFRPVRNEVVYWAGPPRK
ncbi:GNAT family N-acetyltransferase [Kitasatospora sp. NPDC001664]